MTTSSGLADTGPTENPGLPDGSDSPTAVDGRLTGNWIQLGWYWDDSNPAVAYSPKSDQYLVVMVEDNPFDNQRTIAGIFADPAIKDKIDGSGFNIVEGTHHIDNPDVVYDSLNDRFLVVWEEYECFPSVPPNCAVTIKGRLIYASYQGDDSQFAGGTFTIASQISTISTSYDLHDPEVDFNAYNGQYMVVFNQKAINESDYRDIYGRLLNAHTAAPDPSVMERDS
jgi:hypothetical protein